MPTDRDTLPYESAAHRVQPPEGWACKKCDRWWAEDEHLARYCCCTSRPCGTAGCSGRAERSRTICEACIRAKAEERWDALPKKPLPDDLSATPVCVWDDDRYFFDIDDLCAYIDEHGVPRLVLCEPESLPYFEINEFLCDYLPEDSEADDADDEINALIAKAAPKAWIASGVGVDPAWLDAALKAMDE